MWFLLMLFFTNFREINFSSTKFSCKLISRNISEMTKYLSRFTRFCVKIFIWYLQCNRFHEKDLIFHCWIRCFQGIFNKKLWFPHGRGKFVKSRKTRNRLSLLALGNRRLSVPTSKYKRGQNWYKENALHCFSKQYKIMISK